MLSAYHPETNRVAEHTNKIVNQILCFYINQQQKGWVKVLL